MVRFRHGKEILGVEVVDGDFLFDIFFGKLFHDVAYDVGSAYGETSIKVLEILELIDGLG